MPVRIPIQIMVRIELVPCVVHVRNLAASGANYALTGAEITDLNTKSNVFFLIKIYPPGLAWLVSVSQACTGMRWPGLCAPAPAPVARRLCIWLSCLREEQTLTLTWPGLLCGLKGVRPCCLSNSDA